MMNKFRIIISLLVMSLISITFITPCLSKQKIIEPSPTATPIETPVPTATPALDFVKPTDTYLHNSLKWGADWSAWGKCSVCGAGYRHCGVDVDRNSVGMAVKATEKGIVKYAQNTIEWNGCVCIEHTLTDGSKVTSVYYHIKNITVSVGNSVSRGQKIGEISDIKPGNEYDVPHLHFGIRKKAYDSEMSLKGALPTCNCNGYTWPESFINPTNYVISH